MRQDSSMLRSNAKRLLAAIIAIIPYSFSCLLNRNLTYVFYQLKFFSLDKSLQSHRNYFKKAGRGFGEDAFHAAWFYILKKYRPTSALEIGVYRGQTISLWAMISKSIKLDMEIHGISPLSNSGDLVSNYPSVDYKLDIALNFGHFELPTPKLKEDYSNSETGIAYLKSRKWDLIYIDGSHDYPVVLSDYQLAIEAVPIGGILVLDDSSLHTNFTRSFPGHPGPSRVLQENASQKN